VSPPITTAAQFFLSDYDSTLFPLKINRLMVEKYSREMLEFIQVECLSSQGGFQSQQRVFATKRQWFLRPTVKLDPVAELFLYDFVYRNRSLFREPYLPNRKTFGYRIVTGAPIPLLQSYQDYKKAVARNREKFKWHASFDVSSYFNRIYHHDLVAWFENVGAVKADVETFGKFLRQTACGRTIDCLPQGIYPAKMIGSGFLNFLENSNRIRAAQSVRLMDDVWLFDDNPSVLIADFLVAQSLLIDRGLSVNEQKSRIGGQLSSQLESTLSPDEMKIRMLQRRREKLNKDEGYDDSELDGEGDDEDELDELTTEEQDYLLSLLQQDNVPEEDAELVLSLMQDYSSDVLEYLPVMFRDFPGLAKRMYHFCSKVPDKYEVASVVLDYVKGGTQITEFQLFWFGMMVEDYLLKTPNAASLLISLYEHENATDITKAKILEIPEKRFGLPDLREEQLRSAHSNWPAWASAVGSRLQPKAQRNHMLKYFRRSSVMNRLVGEFVKHTF
jgi:Reverse transcriptase (RNA-dependent DNA polymerase)